jgi:hypothetical protein
VTAAAEFFTIVHETFESAIRQAGVICHDYRIGPARVRVRFAGPELVGILTPALEHLKESWSESELGAPDLEICVFDSRSTGTAMVSPAWGPDCYGVRGEITGFNTDRFNTVYQPGIHILQMLDREAVTTPGDKTARGFYWVEDRGIIPYWEQSFPFRSMLHWYLRDQPFQLMHAGAVGTAEGGVLITGPSGSGKSTTCLACLEGGLLYASDDYVLAGIEPPYAYSLYGTAKLVPDNLHRFPELSRRVTNADRLQSEKALIFLQQVRPEALTRGFPIRAILTPRVTGLKDSKLVATSPIVSLKALAPTSMLHLPGYSDLAFAKMSKLVRSVPNFSLEAGTDLRQIPEVIRECIAGLSHDAETQTLQESAR